MRALIFLTVLLLPITALAADLSGSVTITDGDTLRFGDVRVRLIGMDALEARQTCKLDGERYPCGTSAAEALREIIAGRDVRCEHKGLDRYGRTLGDWYVGEDSLSAEMVRLGWSFIDPRFGQDHVELEPEAKERQREGGRVGLAPTGKAPPYHSAHPLRTSRAMR